MGYSPKGEIPKSETRKKTESTIAQPSADDGKKPTARGVSQNGIEK